MVILSFLHQINFVLLGGFYAHHHAHHAVGCDLVTWWAGYSIDRSTMASPPSADWTGMSA